MHILHIFVDSYRFKQLQVFFSSFFLLLFFIFYNLIVTMRKGFKLLETYGGCFGEGKTCKNPKYRSMLRNMCTHTLGIHTHIGFRMIYRKSP